MARLSSRPGRAIFCFVSGVLAVCGWFWWICRENPKTHFLPARAAAEWIVYPNPPDVNPYRIAESSAEFRRDFSLKSPPAKCTLHICAFQSFDVKINGVLQPIPATRPLNWKHPTKLQVEGILREGENHLEVIVSASNGPPALWLALEAGPEALKSDESWEVSWAGAPWRKARMATKPMPMGRGHPLAAGDRPLESLALVWPRLLVFGAIAVCVIAAYWRWNPAKVSLCLLVLIVLLWVALFANNLPALPRLIGFDVDGHLEYIQLLLNNRRLPLPFEGFETYHPPLYYVLSALLLGATSLSVNDDAGVLLLRLQGLAFGIANILLVWAALGRLFPERPQKRMMGLTLAAFVPPSLLLTQFVSNEFLAATLVTAAFYLCLRLLQSSNPSLLLFLGVGGCLGLALLTKVTTVLAVPCIFGAIAYRFLVKSRPGASLKVTEEKTGGGGTLLYAQALLRFCAMVGICGLVAGWYYVRVWHYAGTPLVGDQSGPFHIWQDPGYRTSAFYFRFGSALAYPFYSGFKSFADGINSTLWGDGLTGGNTGLPFTTPWNLPCMAVGYWFALVPTFLVAIGLLVLLRRAIREQRAEWIMFLAFLGIGVFALTTQSIKVPTYSMMKAFYLMSEILPVCVLLALGWDSVAKRSRVLGAVLGGGMVVWALNSFGSCWVRAGSASYHIIRATGFLENGRSAEALASMEAATKADPKNADARSLLAQRFFLQGRADDALEVARATMRILPDDPYGYTDAAVALQSKGDLTNAAALARRSIELAPDDLRGYRVLANIFSAQGRAEEVAAVSREGLRVLPEFPELHLRLGTALAVLANQPLAATDSQPSEARSQLALGARLSGEVPPVLDSVAWILATHPDERVRDGIAAIEFAQRANRLTTDPSAQYLRTMGAAYAEAGRFEEAIESMREARNVAEGSGQKELLEQCSKILAGFSSKRPYREPARLN